MEVARRDPIVSPIQAHLQWLHAKYAGVHDGEVATYIPELAKANPDWFGICLATIDGRVYEVGDSRQLFTVQSISKPLVYGLALEDHGLTAVLAKIGVEPTGDAFNSISLGPGTGCPLNPMINAGAIAAASLVAGHSDEDKLQRLISVLSLYAGRPLTLDQAVYESERDTGHRNRAIGHMLRNFNIISEDPEPALNLYFQQCSVSVHCRDLSLIAATLANGGVNPLTGERAIRQQFVQNVLSVMTTCGMYDYAGEWVYSVGLPAKSGVGGGILAVLPGQLGFGVFSPRLDSRGNSVRGVRVCTDLSRDFDLHFLRVPRSSRSALRGSYSVATLSSKRLRNERERRILDSAGDRAKVLELQGDLMFSAVEAVIRKIVDASEETDFVILDFKRVTHIEQSAAVLLLDLFESFQERGKQIVFVHAQDHSEFLRSFEEGLAAAERGWTLRTFPDLDGALELCEGQILACHDPTSSESKPIALAEHDVCKGLDPAALVRLEQLLERRTFGPGEIIIRKGEPAREFYLLMNGQVRVTLDLPNGQVTRLSTRSPGMTFGELAIVDRSSARTADVRADTAVDCYALTIDAFDGLGKTHPDIKMTLLENLLRNVSQMVARTSQEVATLSR